MPLESGPHLTCPLASPSHPSVVLAPWDPRTFLSSAAHKPLALGWSWGLGTCLRSRVAGLGQMFLKVLRPCSAQAIPSSPRLPSSRYHGSQRLSISKHTGALRLGSLGKTGWCGSCEHNQDLVLILFVQHGAGHFIFLSLGFLCCKMGVIPCLP